MAERLLYWLRRGWEDLVVGKGLGVLNPGLVFFIQFLTQPMT